MSASPELGGKCRACEAIGACLRTQVRIVFSFSSYLFSILLFLLILAPSVNLSVDTFPVCRDGFLVESFWYFSLLLRLIIYFYLSAHACFPCPGSGFFMCVISIFFVLSILIFLFPGIKNICLLLGKQIFRFFYFFMGRK